MSGLRRLFFFTAGAGAFQLGLLIWACLTVSDGALRHEASFMVPVVGGPFAFLSGLVVAYAAHRQADRSSESIRRATWMGGTYVLVAVAILFTAYAARTGSALRFAVEWLVVNLVAILLGTACAPFALVLLVGKGMEDMVALAMIGLVGVGPLVLMIRTSTRW